MTMANKDKGPFPIQATERLYDEEDLEVNGGLEAKAKGTDSTYRLESGGVCQKERGLSY